MSKLSALPTYVASTFGARLTLPASSSEEAVRGCGRQNRILRAPSLDALKELVIRELRAYAMTFVGDSKASRKRGGAGASGTISRAEVAAQVLAALEAGDFRGAVVAHATGFGLGIELPPQLGGGIGECYELPAPRSRRRLVLENAPVDVDALMADDSEESSDESTETPGGDQHVPAAA